MVKIPAAPDVTLAARPIAGVATAFETMSRRYAAMDLDGCTDDERTGIAAMARMTHKLATLAARLAQADKIGDRSPSVASTRAQFAEAVQGFEKRRLVMQSDLERMEAVRLR